MIHRFSSSNAAGRALGALLGILGAVIGGIAAAAQGPQAVSVSYNLYVNGAHVAVMNETYDAKDSTYRIVSESVPLGALALFQKPAKVVSTGQLTPAGLRPERFEGRAIGRGEVRADFDWPGEKLSFGRDGKSETVALPSGTQDRLSIMYQFMFQPFDGRDKLDIAMTDGRRLARYQYAVTRGEEVDTPLGRMGALHLVREDNASTSGNEIWLSPERNFLPVKMVIREDNGTRYEQVATRIEVKPAQQ
jgi:hypothetical protein